MRQLTGLDSAFLQLETPSQFGHVAGLAIFSRPETPADYDPYAAWREQIQERLHLLEPLRRRLVEVPLGLDHPFWIEDPDFDLDFHVRHAAIPPPGGLHELADVVGRMIGRPLERTRPLWLSYVIEGFADDQFAVLTIFHHATVDGASGVELMTIMFDEEREGRPPVERPADDWIGERKPGGLELLARTALTLPRKPARAVLLAAKTAGEIGRATRNPVLVKAADQVRAGLRGPLGAALNLGREREHAPTASLPSLRPPRTPFNAPITPARRLALGSASLDDVRAIKKAFGVTVNDVVVAVCSGGLRAWLEHHDALPDEQLVGLIPISVRTGEEENRWTNRVSMLISALPTDEADPVARLHAVHAAMQTSKDLFQALPAERLTDFAEFPPPAVFARAMRVSSRLHLGSRFTPGNVVISNVPGSRSPLYAAGARLEHYYPLSVVIEGQGLNITVQSYLDWLDFGLVCCPDLVPDVELMLEAILADIDTLRTAAEELDA